MESKSMNRARALKLAGMRSKTGGERVLAALERGRRGLGDDSTRRLATTGPGTLPERTPMVASTLPTVSRGLGPRPL